MQEEQIERVEDEIDALDHIAEYASLRTNDEIHSLIQETEQTLNSLVSELRRRQLEAQHRDIDHLEEHLAHAESNFAALKNFVALALKEIRGER